jgi:catechol 2,3-dioxygenase-like lactoylglutathione lyase family enzyme
MLDNANLIAFLATARPDDSRKFFEKTLGLLFQGETPHTLVFDVNGTLLRVDKVDKLTPASHPAVGFQVTDIVTEARRLTAAGIPMMKVPDREQDGDGIWARPDGTLMAWFQDPDGNIISLSQLTQTW